MSILANPLGVGISLASSLISGTSQTGLVGQGAGDFPVTIGGFQLQGFEIPDAAPFGGSQSMVVHKMPGGARVIDVMGADNRTITIKGTFLSPDADARAQQVDTMRKAGLQIPFSYAGHIYLVVIKEFLPDFHRLDHVSFSLSMEVVQDQSVPSMDAETSPDDDFSDADDQVSNSADDLADNPLAPVTGLYGSVSEALGAITAGVALAASVEAAAALGIPSAMASLQGAFAVTYGAVVDGITGPILGGIAATIAIAGGISASTPANLALMAATIASGQAMLAPVISLSDNYLSASPSALGIVTGQEPEQLAMTATTINAVSTAMPALLRMQANLGVMQDSINAVGT